MVGFSHPSEGVHTGLMKLSLTPIPNVMRNLTPGLDGRYWISFIGIIERINEYAIKRQSLEIRPGY